MWLPGALIATVEERRKTVYSVDVFLCLQSGPSTIQLGDEHCNRVEFLDVASGLIGVCKLRPSHWETL